MSDFIVSQIRTYVPIFVGAAISYLASIGLELDAETSMAAILTLTSLLQAVYYFIVRKLEMRYPQLGWLLGSTKKPEYTNVK